MRILHIVDSSRFSPRTMLALVSDLVGVSGEHEHRVVITGGKDFADSVHRLGLRNVVYLDRPRFFHPWMLNRWGSMARGHLGGEGTFDVIHGWSLAAAVMGGAIFPEVPRLATVAEWPESAYAGQRAALHRYPALLMPISQSLEASLNRSVYGFLPTKVIEPGVDVKRIRHDTAQKVRESWKVDDATTVMGLLGDPIWRTDAVLGFWVASMIHDTGRAVRLVTGPNAGQLDRVKRIVRDLGRKDFLIIDSRVEEPWEVAGACDVVLNLHTRADHGGCHADRPGHPVEPRTAPGLSTAWTMRAGTTVVCESQKEEGWAWVEREKTGLVAEANQAAGLAAAVIRLIDSKELASRVSEEAGQEAARRFGVERYARELEGQYERAVEAGRGVWTGV